MNRCGLALLLFCIGLFAACAVDEKIEEPVAPPSPPPAPAAPKDEVGDRIREALPETCTAPPLKARKILVFSRCEGYVHGCIPTAAKAITIMGAKTGAFTAEFSDDMAVFDRENLARFDAVLFNNTTHLAFEDPLQRQALMEFVKSGKGIVGLHAASDNFYEWPEAAEMMGGLFDGHPWGAGGTWAVKIDEPDHPLNRAFGGRAFALRDEIYQIKGPYSRDTHRVLLSLDMSSLRNQKVEGVHREDGDFAVAWIRKFGQGRVFYCSLGHNDEVFWNPAVLRHYLDGIQYALGDLKADDRPSSALIPLPVPARTTDPGGVDDPYTAIPGYQIGDSRTPLALLEETIRSASPEELGRIEERLLAILDDPAATWAGKQFVLRMEERIGTDRSIPVLCRLLEVEGLADPARAALERIPSAVVNPLLRKALVEVAPAYKAGIMGALARRKDRDAVPLLADWAQSPDANLAAAAITALGRIGGAEAAKALVWKEGGDALLPLRLAASIECARTLLKEGDAEGALALFRKVAGEEQAGAHGIAAWQGIIDADPDAALANVLSLLKSDDVDLVEAGARFLERLPLAQDLAPLYETMPSLSFRAQALAVNALSDRKDSSAAPAVAATIKIDDPALRRAALDALGVLGGAGDVALLVAALDREDVALKSLIRLQGDGVNEAIIERMVAADAKTKKTLMTCLRERRAKEALPYFMDYALDEDEGLSAEALAGLACLATMDDLLPLLRLAELGVDTREAIAALFDRMGDEEKAADLVIETLPGKSPEAQGALLYALGRFPTGAALKALIHGAKAKEEAVWRPSLEAMAMWPTRKPMETLLDLAKTGTPPERRASAFEGYLSMLERDRKDPGEDANPTFEEAMTLASDLKDKERVLALAGTKAAAWALEFLKPYQEDPSLGPAAREAVLKVKEALARGVPHEAQGCPVTLVHAPVERYDGGGPNALTDGVWGTAVYGEGHWQGFEGQDLDAVVDLGRVMPIQSIRAGFLKDMNSWIFLPVRVEFALSDDGETYRPVACFIPDPPEEIDDPATKSYFAALDNAKARYIRVFAQNIGHCPDWHPGAGGEAWLFADEIQVNPKY